MVQNKTTADEKKKKKNDGMGGMVIKTNLRLSELGLAKMRNDIARQRGDAVLSLLFVLLFFFSFYLSVPTGRCGLYHF